MQAATGGHRFMDSDLPLMILRRRIPPFASPDPSPACPHQVPGRGYHVFHEHGGAALFCMQSHASPRPFFSGLERSAPILGTRFPENGRCLRYRRPEYINCWSICCENRNQQFVGRPCRLRWGGVAAASLCWGRRSSGVRQATGLSSPSTQAPRSRAQCGDC
jgi:hypothetical protein